MSISSHFVASGSTTLNNTENVSTIEINANSHSSVQEAMYYLRALPIQAQSISTDKWNDAMNKNLLFLANLHKIELHKQPCSKINKIIQHCFNYCLCLNQEYEYSILITATTGNDQVLTKMPCALTKQQAKEIKKAKTTYKSISPKVIGFLAAGSTSAAAVSVYLGGNLLQAFAAALVPAAFANMASFFYGVKVSQRIATGEDTLQDIYNDIEQYYQSSAQYLLRAYIETLPFEKFNGYIQQGGYSEDEANSLQKAWPHLNKISTGLFSYEQIISLCNDLSLSFANMRDSICPQYLNKEQAQTILEPLQQVVSYIKNAEQLKDKHLVNLEITMLSQRRDVCADVLRHRQQEQIFEMQKQIMRLIEPI